MKSQPLGPTTSRVEVQNVSAKGIWLYVNGKEYFLAHSEYPWFRDARIGEVLNVQVLHGGHLCWPDLGVDLDVDTFEHPDAYPLIFR
jgi:hypothetical protein